MTVADARYVSLTTYRRSGEAVATPVWIAPLAAGRAGFTTGADSGKVKRLGNDARITVRPCDARGRVADGAEEAAGTGAVVIDDPAFEEIRTAMRAKYGWQFALVATGGRLKALVGRAGAANCGVVLTFS